MSEINEKCSCKWVKCKRHGDCVACREHHKTVKKTPPFCELQKLKSKEAEAGRAERRTERKAKREAKRAERKS